MQRHPLASNRLYQYAAAHPMGAPKKRGAAFRAPPKGRRTRAAAGTNPQTAYPSDRFPHPSTGAARDDLITNLAYTTGAQRSMHPQNPATLAVRTGGGGLEDQMHNHYAISRHTDPPPAFAAWDAMWNYAENTVPLTGSSIGEYYFPESLTQIRLPPTSNRWGKVGIASFPSEEESARRKLAGEPNFVVVDNFHFGPTAFV